MGRVLRIDKAEILSGRDRRHRKGLVQLTVEVPHALYTRFSAVAAFKKKRPSDFHRYLIDKALRTFTFDEFIRSGLPETEVPSEEEA